MKQAPFTAADLEEMDEAFFSRASAVVALEDVSDGNRDPNSIGLRHDVDASSNNTRHALDTAVKIAEWEANRGYRSTYYILHTAPYWMAPGFTAALDRIAECGHEIGIHTNAIAEALRIGRDPDSILAEALATLRGLGFEVRGAAGHGDPSCNRDAAPGESHFANDEQFLECARPGQGAPDRTITRGNASLTLNPRSLADFGLEYEALQVAYAPNGARPFRISDSGGHWNDPGWDWFAENWQGDERQLHFLWHPDWWQHAFVEVTV